jgi:hypothetical protein
MTITPEFKEMITGAEARAFGTFGPQGVNVVPVSVVDITDARVCLYNFFMGKTVENLLTEPTVAHTVWKGLQGIQIKATAEYVTSGEAFNTATATMKVRFPDRTLSGLIYLTPTAVYDISVGAAAGTLLAS